MQPGYSGPWESDKIMEQTKSGGGAYSIVKQIKNGIEWISYIPSNRRHSTPLLLQHGMWHGAWCWQHWQELLAEAGWESHAISLPGHGASPATRSVRFSTMGQYLDCLAQQIRSMPMKPVLFGHSMGGALVQWYLKKVADDLPGVVLVGSWTAHSTMADGTMLHLKRDPVGFLLAGLTLSSTAFVRSPKWAHSVLTTGDALYSPEALYDHLCEESALVLTQHNPPFWNPPKDIKTPMLWVAAEKDAVISLKGAENSARFYNADLMVIQDTGHNLMMEQSYAQTLASIETWLSNTVG